MTTLTILNQYFPFYKTLSSKEQSFFEERVLSFIDHKNFIAKGELDEVTDEMRVIISACAIQLTFRLGAIYLDQFKDILVYPDQFYSNYTDDYQITELHPSGALIVSWRAVAHGCLIPHDGINPGLNLMAKALSEQNWIEGPECNFFDNNALAQWKKYADAVFDRWKYFKGPFREEIFSDRKEFFPGCVEYFFEQPQLFEENYPDLYKALKKLLKF